VTWHIRNFRAPMKGRKPLVVPISAEDQRINAELQRRREARRRLQEQAK
jgi:hypothetical protein